MPFYYPFCLYYFSIINLDQLFRISNPFLNCFLDLNLLLSKLYCYLTILFKLFPSKYNLLFSPLNSLYSVNKLLIAFKIKTNSVESIFLFFIAFFSLVHCRKLLFAAYISSRPSFKN